MQLMVVKGHSAHVRNGESLPINWLARLAESLT